MALYVGFVVIFCLLIYTVTELNKHQTPHRASFYMRPFHLKVKRDFGNVVSDSLKMALMDVFIPLPMYRHQRQRYIGCYAQDIYFFLLKNCIFQIIFQGHILCFCKSAFTICKQKV